MDLLALAIMFAAGIWGGIYLIMNDHPWFGLLVIIATCSIRYSNKKEEIVVDGKEKEEEW